MSNLTAPKPRTTSPASFGARLWFIWMVAMWTAFFVLLLSNRLDGIWHAILQLPLVVEIILWVVFLPWMLGMAVWTSSWADGLRVVLVLCFAAGWTIVSFPWPRKVRGLPPHGYAS